MSGLVLASASRTRRAMLEAAGVPFDTEPARVDEEEIRLALVAAGAPPRDVADKLAELKALRISSRRAGEVVLGADQVLDHRGEILSKPESRQAAAAQLARLSGGRHVLLSAAVIAIDGAPVWRHVGEARLFMRELSPEFIEGYVERAGDEVLSCVGAYQVEGLGAQLFSRIEGDFFSILGLPLLPLLEYLRTRRILPA